MCGHTCIVVTYSKFYLNPFRGFNATRIEIGHYHYCWLLAFSVACSTIQAVVNLAECC